MKLIDSSQTLEIGKSPFKILKLFLTFVFVCVLVPIFAWFALALYFSSETTLYHPNTFGVVLFAAAALAATCASIYGTLRLWDLISRPGPLLTLSPAGICDTRISFEVIPWPAVRTLDVGRIYRMDYVFLTLDPAVLQSLSLRPLVRFHGLKNVQFWTKGLSISNNDLKISFEDLVVAIHKYATDHGAFR